jgi:ribosome-associated heat shock protein Hsp15
MPDWQMSEADTGSTEPGRVRLDKWLWAARFFKTRSLAADAIDGGKVDVNGERAKRARLVQVGDAVCVRRPPFATHATVRGVSEHRGRAVDATRLYLETAASRAAADALAAQLRALPRAAYEKGRPSKKDRRTIDRWRGR